MLPTLVMGGSQLSAYGWSGDHPFGLDRHGAFEQAMGKLDFGDAVRFESAPPAGPEELERFHSRDYLEFARRRCEEDRGFLDGGDTPARSGLFEAARHVVGAALHATDAIMKGSASNAFLPIGGLHHAGREHAAGFCVLNDIGVVVETLRAIHGVQRIAYVDIDVHHGDGVYYAYEGDPLLFFADIHEDGRWQYPGTGGENERGRGLAHGSKINLCLEPGDGDPQFLAAFEKAEAHIRECEPEFILLQCGADGLRGDPLGRLNYSARAHAHAAKSMCALARSACRGRILAMGGGGYSRKNLASAWTEVVRKLVEPDSGPIQRRCRYTCRTRNRPHFIVTRCPENPRTRRRPMATEYPEIARFDPRLAEALQAEVTRQEDFVELIASENYASRRVMEAQGSVLTNKYAEGYPGRRYYGGCEHVDVAESLAIERASRLFGADYVNVQPHSGTQANTAAYLALLKPGEGILGMDLSHGGHLTHGSPVNISGKLFKVSSYGLDPKTEQIDYDQLRDQALKNRPRMIVGGFSAYSRVADWKIFREVADEVGAYLMVDMAHVAGLVAVDEYPNPTPLADVVTSTTHKTLRGPRGGLILARDNPEITKRLRSLVFPGTQGGPLMHAIAAKAVAFEEALQPEFRDYQRQVKRNAAALADGLSARGLRIVSGKTENHLFLVDLGERGVTGAEAEEALDRANITVNKNTVPNDSRPPMVTSGLRLGTPACTTRGFGEPEIAMLVDSIASVVGSPDNEAMIARVRERVLETCRRFPVYS